MKVLDIGSGNGVWVLIESFENPDNVYVSLDNRDGEKYRINSPQRAYRFLVGQAVLRVQERLGLDPNDAEIGGFVNYLGSDYQLDDAKLDKEAITRLGEYESGRTLLDAKADIPFSDDVGINGRTIRNLFQFESTERVMKYLQREMRHTYNVAGDLNQMPFKDNTFDYVRSSGTVGNYSSDSALREAQRVLKNGKIVRSMDGIETSNKAPE